MATAGFAIINQGRQSQPGIKQDRNYDEMMIRAKTSLLLFALPSFPDVDVGSIVCDLVSQDLQLDARMSVILGVRGRRLRGVEGLRLLPGQGVIDAVRLLF